MAIEWKIINTEYNNDSDKGVVHASWQCTDSETVGSGDSAVVHVGTVSGMESYTPDASAEGYIAYASLKESDVIGWVETFLGTDQINQYKTVIEEVIQEKATPTVVRKYVSE